MKKKNVFLVLLSVVVISALAVTFLPQKSPKTQAATTDTLGITINLGTALDITVDTADISIADLTPGTADTDETTTLTVSSNDPTGFHVTALIRDLDGASGAELCVNSGTNTCHGIQTEVFDTDEGTHSYFKVQVDTTASTVDDLTSYDSAYDVEGSTVFTTTATELMEADDQTEVGVDDSLVVDYEIYADSTVPERQYEGDVLFTIVSGL